MVTEPAFPTLWATLKITFCRLNLQERLAKSGLAMDVGGYGYGVHGEFINEISYE